MIGYGVLIIAFFIGATLWARSIIIPTQNQWKLDGREFHRHQLFLTYLGSTEIKNITILYEDFVAFGDILKTDLLIHYCNTTRKTHCGRKELTSLLFFDFQKPRNETLTRVEFVSLDRQMLGWLASEPPLSPSDEKSNSISCSIETSENLMKRFTRDCKYSKFFHYSSDWNDFYNITSLLVD